ncbi:MAG: hypothetical protein ACSI46_03510 [Gloeotrichia echinulata DVL01]
MLNYSDFQVNEPHFYISRILYETLRERAASVFATQRYRERHATRTQRRRIRGASRSRSVP